MIEAAGIGRRLEEDLTLDWFEDRHLPQRSSMHSTE